MQLPADLNAIMDRATAALMKREYLAGESLCLEALRQAKSAATWDDYARILLPLQECRRQRRQIAVETAVRLGTADLTGPPMNWLEGRKAGAIVVSHPHGREPAHELQMESHRLGLFVEVLWADNDPAARWWTLRSFTGPAVSVTLDAPAPAWLNRWVGAGDAREPSAGHPADWFVDATQALGDAALRTVQSPLGSLQRIEQLERALAAMTDHEILHQRLGDAARAMLLMNAPPAPGLPR